MKKKKDPFEEAVEILNSYKKGLPKMQPERCCSSGEEHKKKRHKHKKAYYEAEF